MTRSFADRPIDDSLLRELCDDALRAPTAGNTRGTALVVLTDASDRAAYWEAATDAAWRARSARFAGLRRAPTIVLVLCEPTAYVERYAAPDKARSGLGEGADAWPVPYWFGDAAFVAMGLLLGATAHDLGAAFLGAFRGVDAIKDAFAIPPTWELFATVLLGHPDGEDHRSASLDRTAPRTSRLHFGAFGAPTA
jgi:nitroreductase